MALIKYGGGVASMQGKQGGAVHARNRAGAYIRNWAKPTNSPTDIQTVRRTDFAARSAEWSALTDEQRDAWNSWASGLTLLNRMGDTYVPTGRQMYMSCNNNLNLIGHTSIADPPIGEVPPTINPAMTLEIISLADSLQTFTIRNGDVEADVYWLCFGAPYQIAGKRNLTTAFRVIYYPPSADPVDLETWYTAIFGPTFPVGAYSQVRVRSINGTTGLSSPQLIIEATATAASTGSALVADAGTTSVNGTYTLRGSEGGRDYFNLIGEPDDPFTSSIYWEGAGWLIQDGSGDTMYFSEDDTATPWEATTWQYGSGDTPIPTVTEA